MVSKVLDWLALSIVLFVFGGATVLFLWSAANTLMNLSPEQWRVVLVFGGLCVGVWIVGWAVVRLVDWEDRQYDND